MSAHAAPPPATVDTDAVRKLWRTRLRKAYIAQPPAWWLLQLGLDDMSAAFQQLPPFYDQLSAPDAVKVFVGLAGIRDSLTPVMRRYLAIATNLEATSRWDNVPPEEKAEAGDICPICADEYHDAHTVVRPPCAHFLHRDCLEVSEAESSDSEARRVAWLCEGVRLPECEKRMALDVLCTPLSSKRTLEPWSTLSSPVLVTDSQDWLDKGHTTCPFCRRDFTILCMMYMWAGTENIQGTIEMWKNKDQIMSVGQ